MSGDIDAARAILRGAGGDRVREDVAMAPFTTFRIGGPGALFLEPESIDDLHAVARAMAATGIPVAIVGKGSNILVADQGFPGRGLDLRGGGGGVPGGGAGGGGGLRGGGRRGRGGGGGRRNAVAGARRDR